MFHCATGEICRRGLALVNPTWRNSEAASAWLEGARFDPMMGASILINIPFETWSSIRRPDRIGTLEHQIALLKESKGSAERLIP